MVIAVSVLSAVVLFLGGYLLKRLDDARGDLANLTNKVNDLEKLINETNERTKYIEKSVDEMSGRLKSLQEQVAGLLTGGGIETGTSE